MLVIGEQCTEVMHMMKKLYFDLLCFRPTIHSLTCTSRVFKENMLTTQTP